MAIQVALQKGTRGLPGGSTLARMLAEERGARDRMRLPSLTLSDILAWADADFERTGTWPKEDSGPIPESPGDTWSSVKNALLGGRRGLPSGISLAQLLAQERGVLNHLARPLLTTEQILAWADAHHQRTGYWPKSDSGTINGDDSETWSAINHALRKGSRGLPGGASLCAYSLMNGKSGTSPMSAKSHQGENLLTSRH